MIGEVHEAIHQVWLAHVGRQGTQLLVGGKAATPRGLPHSPFLKDLGLPGKLHSPSLSCAPCNKTPSCKLDATSPAAQQFDANTAFPAAVMKQQCWPKTLWKCCLNASCGDLN